MKFTPRTDTLALAPGTTRLVVLGDPHGDVAALRRVLALEERPGTAFVSVGDNVGYGDGPASSELCRILESKGIRSTIGNHEHMVLPDGRLFLTSDPDACDQLTEQAFSYSSELPLRLEIEHPKLADLKVVVTHALFAERSWDYVSESNVALLLEHANADVVFSGHSHRPAVWVVPPRGSPLVTTLDPASDEPLEARLFPGSRYVVDAGSIARAELAGKRPSLARGSYAVLDLAARQVRVQAFEKS